jgi:hypothetical protein
MTDNNTEAVPVCGFTYDEMACGERGDHHCAPRARYRAEARDELLAVVLLQDGGWRTPGRLDRIDRLRAMYFETAPWRTLGLDGEYVGVDAGC